MRPFRKTMVQSNSGLRKCNECDHVSVKFGSFQYIAHVIAAAVLQIAAENLANNMLHKLYCLHKSKSVTELNFVSDYFCTD